ncbi:SRPBCC family protein [Phaeacidiphilus oryzae]|uniref:SRPBCC family protein n=1 Tax=Phaeacidiphilus oryzae TaxID=348818 RepID=UPI0005664793|nr:SRPBCC family protein [Phaeacidiphilus oryzae]
MADSALGNSRLGDALQDYLRARTEHALNGLGRKVGEATAKLTENPGALTESLTGGKSPGAALAKVGADQLKQQIKDRTIGGVKERLGGLLGKGRGGKGRGGAGGRSITIVEDIDVGVPVRTAYDQWTQFQEFPTWAHGVKSVDRADDVTSNWKAKVFWSTRSWQGKVIEQVPDERIAWSSEGAKGTTKGVVTFHSLGPNLTKVLLVIEYFPKGLFEKTGNIWRAQGRRARLDLKLYRRFISTRNESTGAWRGEIRDGEVVLSHEDAVQEEEESSAQDQEQEREEDREREEDLAPEDEASAEEPEEPESAEEPEGPDELDEFGDELPEEDLPEEELPEEEDELPEEEDELPEEEDEEADELDEYPDEEAEATPRRRAPARR